MISLTRLQISRVRAFARAALGVGAKTAVVSFVAEQDKLSIRAVGPSAAVELRLVGQFEPCSFAMPLEALANCAGKSNDPVDISIQPDRGDLRWHDKAIPQNQPFEVREVPSFPAAPESWMPNDMTVIAALRDASESIDILPTRSAINNLRLSGENGQIAATDGRQLYSAFGFDFPWKGELLVQALPVFKLSHWTTLDQIGIGKTQDHVAIRGGDVTVYLAIDKDGQFPKIDSHLHAAREGSSVAWLAASDRKFLLQNLSGLPGALNTEGTVTIDLNGIVMVRSADTDSAHVVGIMLSNSNHRSKYACVAMDRALLQRALGLGFMEIHVNEDGSQVWCRDSYRTFLWATLRDSAIVPPSELRQLVNSPVDESLRRRRRSSKETSTA